MSTKKEVAKKEESKEKKEENKASEKTKKKEKRKKSIKKLSDSKLVKELESVKEELDKVTWRLQVGKEGDSSKRKKLKKRIARIKTEMNQRKSK
jgi:ribosomal protein L29